MARTLTAASRARHSSVSTVRARTWELSRSDRPGIRRAIFTASSARTSSFSSSASKRLVAAGAAGIGRHRAAHGGRAMLGEIMQHVRTGIGPGRQLGRAALHLLAGADVQNIERIAGIETRRRQGAKLLAGPFLRPPEGRILARGALTGFKKAWVTRVNGPCAPACRAPCSRHGKAAYRGK